MPGNKPKTLSRKETEFLLKKRTRNGSATYAAVEHEHTEYDEVATPEDYNAVGNGTTDDTNAVASAIHSGKLVFLPNKDYYTPGSIASFTRPTLILADNASESGTKLPFVSITSSPFKNIPQNYVFIQQNNSDRNDEYTFQIQRIVNVDTGYSSPKAFRVISTNNVTTATANEWAGVFEMVNYGSTGEANLALGLIGRKYGTSPIFALNPIVWDYNHYTAATSVTGEIGIEINNKAIGLDHPTANRSTGNRRSLYIVPRTNKDVATWNDGTGNFGEGEIGAAIYISTDYPQSLSYFRYGVVVDELVSNPNPIGTGIMIRTTGNNGLLVNGDLVGSANSAAIRVDSNTVFGLLLTGSYTGPAIRMEAGQSFAQDGTSTNRMKYGTTADVWGFYRSGTERFGVDMSSGDIRVNGTKVIGAQNTGWTADTGTAKKTANATYSGTASAGYVQAEMTGVMNALQDATQTIKALKDAAITHGWIGA